MLTLLHTQGFLSLFLKHADDRGTPPGGSNIIGTACTLLHYRPPVNRRFTE